MKPAYFNYREFDQVALSFTILRHFLVLPDSYEFRALISRQVADFIAKGVRILANGISLETKYAHNALKIASEKSEKRNSSHLWWCNSPISILQLLFPDHGLDK